MPSHLKLPCIFYQGGSKPNMTDTAVQSQVHITQLYEENSNKRAVLTSQPNGLAPLNSTRPGLLPPDRQTSATDPAHHGRQGSATSNKSTESKTKPNPLTPEQAMKQFMSKMSTFEHHEIFSFTEGKCLYQSKRFMNLVVNINKSSKN